MLCRCAEVQLQTARQDDELSTAATISLRLMQVHLSMLYGLMGISKLMTESWWNGLGVWWLLTCTESRLVYFTWLYNYPLT